MAPHAPPSGIAIARFNRIHDLLVSQNHRLAHFG
jgi:hypothetical protein